MDRFVFLAQLKVRHRAAIAGAAFLAALALSLAVFLLVPGVRSRRVLFFPLVGSHRMTTELRAVPRHRDPERAARELVDAVLLGPQRPDAEPLFPRGASVRALLLRRGVLYVDLDARAALSAPEAPLPLAAAVEALERTVRFNLRRVRDVLVSVDRQVPRAPAGGKKS